MDLGGTKERMERKTEEDVVEDVEDKGELDLGGTKECMKRETEEDLVEDVEDKGELELVDGGEDDDLRDNLDDSTHDADDTRDSTSDYNLRKIYFSKRKCECSLDVRNTLPCKKLFYEDGFIPSRKKKMKKENRRKKKGKIKNEIPTEMELQRCVIPSEDNPSPEMTEWLYQFQRWSNCERSWAIDRLIERCEPSRVRHIMQLIESQFQKDLIFPLSERFTVLFMSFQDLEI